MIVIVDYQTGNLASVLNMTRKVGADAKISSDRNDILKASKLILPGVGAFDYGISQLTRCNVLDAITDRARAGVPLLGICLGMQLLANRSEEGVLPGLGLIDAEFKRFEFPKHVRLKVPHVGWNLVRVRRESPLMMGLEGELRYYFVHSYHAVCKREEDVLATTEHGFVFPSAYARENIYGVQFHPEKSHRFGMALIKNFVERC